MTTQATYLEMNIVGTPSIRVSTGWTKGVGVAKMKQRLIGMIMYIAGGLTLMCIVGGLIPTFIHTLIAFLIGGIVFLAGCYILVVGEW